MMTSDTTAVPDELVRAAAAGDREAVGRLLAVVRPYVVRYCRARLGPSTRSPAVDDVAQEVCLAVLTGLPGYRFESKPFLAFVYGVAAHKVIDAHRAATRTRWDLDVDVPDSDDTTEGPEQRALRAELPASCAGCSTSCPTRSARSSCCGRRSGCRPRRPRRRSGPPRARCVSPSTGPCPTPPGAQRGRGRVGGAPSWRAAPGGWRGPGSPCPS